MIKEISKINTKLVLFLKLLFLSNIIYAQNTPDRDKRFFVKITIGVGMGSGYQKQMNNFGVTGLGEIVLNKEKNFLNIGSRGISELYFLATPTVSNSLSTAEMTYGRLFKKIEYPFLLLLEYHMLHFKNKEL